MLYGFEKLANVDKRLREFAELAGKLLPFDVQVTAGHRSDAEQAALYAQGRTKPGPNATAARPLGDTVTNARSSSTSAHGRGMAIDLVPRINGRPSWAEWSLFEQIGELAESQGLDWGGRWLSIKDGPHVEVPGWKQAATFLADAVSNNKGTVSVGVIAAIALALLAVMGSAWR